jgi:hypothetical protein
MIPMADKTTTTFPKMGTANAKAVNQSAAPSKNTKPVRKRSTVAAGPAEPATAAHRQGIQERLGAQGAPQVTMSYPQAPEASQTQRNVRILPSAIGNRDFYLKRQYGQTLQ